MRRRQIGKPVLVSLAALLVTTAAGLRGQDATSSDRVSDVAAAPWELETLTLKDGTVYRGLLKSAGDDEIEFAEIFRRPGKPMSAAIRVVGTDRVRRVERLPDERRRVLAQRFRQFKHRASIEAGLMEKIQLREIHRDGLSWQVYEGNWFSLDSTAGEEATRRCIVRLEQIFRAYRQLLPPRFEPRRDLRIRLRGSQDEYRSELSSWRLNVENPAIYSLPRNTIVAGSDLSSFSTRLAQIRQQHEQIVKRYDQLGLEFKKRLARLREELARNNLGREEIKDELAVRRFAWKAEYEATLRRINEANRRNDDRFAQVTARMFSRLYHEAFHAYLENYVFPHDRFQVARWLNEGMAQIFEHGLLEADTLRVDAPPAEMLSRLQSDLVSAEPLRLIDLLSAPQDAFLGTHLDRLPDRRYLYAWGLAYFLVFEQAVLNGPALDRYVSRQVAEQPAVERFEQLVGMELEEFERLWRDAMLEESRGSRVESRRGQASAETQVRSTQY